MTNRLVLCACTVLCSSPARAAEAATAPGEAIFAFLRPEAAAGTAAACRAERSEGGLLKAALFSPATARCPVALVGGEIVTLEDLAATLTAAHEMPRERAPRVGSERPGKDFGPALERLVRTRLLAREAGEMGLPELPEMKDAMAVYKASVLRILLQKKAAEGIRSDPAEVDRLYKDAVREWKLRSILFEKEEDAKAFLASVNAGGSFEELAKQAVAAGKGRDGGAPEFVPTGSLLPQVRTAAEKAGVGKIAPLVEIPGGRVALRVEAVRYRDDPAAKAEAERRSLARRQGQAIRGFYERLVARRAKVNRAVLGSLDFEAPKPGFAALAKDRRVLVEIAGGPPITVADLAAELQKKFFHGMEGPIKERRVNAQKADAFETLLGSRLFALEAAARKLERTEAYRKSVGEYARALAFSGLVERVIAPGVRVGEEEARRYYREHDAEFSAPQMFRLDGLAFGAARDAQAALGKLKGGTDLVWLRANADGQLPAPRRLVSLDPSAVVSVNGLPPELATALTGARAGDARLYADPRGQFYVVRVVEEFPPTKRPWEEAREEIAKKLHQEKLAKAIEEYAAQVRKVWPVEVYITRIST